MATRKASRKVIQWAAAQVPQLVSGSADLEPSTLTEIEDGGVVRAAATTAAATSTTACASTAWGAIVNGLEPARLARVRLHVLQLPRLHEARRCGWRP